MTASEMSVSLVAQTVKHLPTMRGTWVRSLGQEDGLEKEMATHSSILAWKVPWMEKPARLQSMGSQKVGHDWATSRSLSVSELLGHEEVILRVLVEKHTLLVMVLILRDFVLEKMATINAVSPSRAWDWSLHTCRQAKWRGQDTRHLWLSLSL